MKKNSRCRVLFNIAIKRYHHNPQWSIEDTGMMVYHYEKGDPKENYLELKFCVSGNVYCKQKDTECNMCKAGLSRNCVEKADSVDVVSFKFFPAHLSQFVKPRNGSDTLNDKVLNFKHAIFFYQDTCLFVAKQEWYWKHC